MTLATPQVHLKIEDFMEDLPDTPTPKNRYKSRQPHVHTDTLGNEKTFGSALGLLTRKFLDIIYVSRPRR